MPISDMLEGLLRQTSVDQGGVSQLDKRLGVAEEKTWGTGGQHVVQSGRQPLVEAQYFEGVPDSRDRLNFVYLLQWLHLST